MGEASQTDGTVTDGPYPEIIMSPAETALLRPARERGLPAHPGEPMLAHQIDAYLEFFGL